MLGHKGKTGPASQERCGAFALSGGAFVYRWVLDHMWQQRHRLLCSAPVHKGSTPGTITVTGRYPLLESRPLNAVTKAVRCQILLVGVETFRAT